MKWLSSKYAYVLIVLSLVVSIALQAAWLLQLFSSQKILLKEKLEHTVRETAKNTIYDNLRLESKKSARFKAFFLSPQWLQMRQAFDDLKVNGVHSIFRIGIDGDSSVVEMRFSFNNSNAKNKNTHYDVKLNKESPQELAVVDKMALSEMDSTVKAKISALGVHTPLDYALYDYGRDTLISMTLTKDQFKKAAFRSSIYSYNLKHLHKYQVIIGHLDGAVLYQMRYYILSSLLMIVLTGAAFYFLLYLMRNQRMYAEAKINFTNNMTHEFKTPIATVLVALESIEKYKLINQPDKLNNYLNISTNELQRLNIMVENVLQLDQQNTGYGTLHMQPYDLQLGLNEVIKSMSLQLEQHNSTLHFNADTKEPHFVNGHPIHLKNVLYNLIDNAIKYSSPNGKIKVSCNKKGDKIELRIEDNGLGIANIYRDKIFERFFRIPTHDIHNVKGSGLGLHYVKETIDQHGGHIFLSSEIGKGSIFIITLTAL